MLSGTGKINGNVTNRGTIRPGGTGAAGTLTVTGNYTQTSTGVLDIELGGTAAGTYDQLNVSGIATLAGSLTVSLINGFNPTANDMFIVILFGALGTETMTEPSGYFADYNSNDLTLVKT